MTMEKIELKPCPFCGGCDICINEQEEYHSHGRFYAYCGDCYATGPNRKDAKSALLAWNRRVNERNREGEDRQWRMLN